MRRCSALIVVILTAVLAILLASPAAPAQQNSNPLLEELKSQDANIRARAVRDIASSGDTTAVPGLTAALNDPSPKVRKEIIVALAKLHTNAALDGLVIATRDSDPGVRAMGVQAMVGWYTGNVPSTGFRGTVKRSYNGAVNWFQTDTTHIRPGATVDPRTITALEAAMEDARSIDAARDAARGLGILLARPAVPALVKAAHSPDAGLAVNALGALSKIKDISAGPQLVDLLNSPSKDVRSSACVTVGILRTESAVPKLQQMYDSDADNGVRKAALDGLAFIGAPSSYAVFIKALWSQDKDERAYAAEGLARMRDPKAGANLEKRMKIEKDAGVKLAILFAEVSIGETDHLRDLVDSLTSRTRGDVAQSYLIELTRQKTLLNDIYSYLNDSNSTIRRRLCVVLMYSGDASSLPHLSPLTHDRNSDVAAAALRASQSIRSRA